MTDARLQELYERALTAREGDGRERCASPEAILALVRHEGTEEARLETLDHVMACASCSREFELLRSIELAGAESVRAGMSGSESAVPAGEHADVVAHIGDAGVVVKRGRVWRWRRIAPLALAASLLLAVGVGVLNRDGREEADVFRGEAEAVVLMAPPVEVAPDSPIVFTWRPVAEARRYEVEVMDDEGTLVFAATTGDTTVSMQDVVRLVPGTDYRWLVRATSSGGAQRASAPRRLRIRAR